MRPTSAEQKVEQKLDQGWYLEGLSGAPRPLRFAWELSLFELSVGQLT